MKTVLATTCWLDNEDYLKKTQKWLNYYENLSDLNYDEIVLIDNASSKENIKKLEGSKFRVLYHSKHYARNSHLDYKYLWQAIFSFNNLSAENIIYMDNDFYMLSDKMTSWANNLISGWNSPWCPKHNFPETGLQILLKPNMDYDDFIRGKTIDDYNGEQMETTLPVAVERSLIGDRYSEFATQEIPSNADFSAQTMLETEVIYRGKK